MSIVFQLLLRFLSTISTILTTFKRQSFDAIFYLYQIRRRHCIGLLAYIKLLCVDTNSANWRRFNKICGSKFAHAKNDCVETISCFPRYYQNEFSRKHVQDEFIAYRWLSSSNEVVI